MIIVYKFLANKIFQFHILFIMGKTNKLLHLNLMRILQGMNLSMINSKNKLHS